MENKIKLSDAYELFLLDCQARRLTPSTLIFYQQKVKRFTNWLTENGINTLDAITSHHIKAYLVSLQERGLKDNSQHDYARAVKTFLNYCVRDELLDKSPFVKVKMPIIGDRLPVILSDSEIKTALTKTKHPRNKVIIRFILDSGVRASELLNLNVGDVDFVNGVVTVHQGKQQKDRLTSIGSTTRKALKRYLLERGKLEPNEPLFAHQHYGTRLTLIGLMSMFRTIQEQTGIDTLTAHTLRRTMATKSLENGMDAYVLAQMLGHADTQVLRKYARVSKARIQNQSDKFGVVDNLKY